MIGKQPARIITFYSYKGGTGRSMALANWAWILAFQGKRVLAIDWDVEAPGLHRYFRPFLIDKDLRASTGVIDFAVHFATESVKPSDDSLPPEWYFEHADISEHAIALDWNFPGGGRIDFVPAGRQDENYATLVSTFSWQNFYENLGGGALIDAMRKLLRDKGEYDVVLIDSRTGVSDTAGICTVQLPDTLICCFTYNNQSTDGASAIAASAQQLRRQPEYARGGLEDLVVYPIPMRVDPFEEDRLRERQAYAWNVFEPILPANVNVPREYWLGVEVPYKPALSYEEQLAVFRDESSDPKSALTAFLRACGYVFGPEAASLPSLLSPEDRQQVIADFARTAGAVDRVAASAESTAEAAARRAETIYQRLSPEDQVLARRLWLALIRTTESYESSAISSFRLRASDAGDAYTKIASSFVEGGALKMEIEGDESYLSIASPSILFGWKRFVEWTDHESGFLSWRQRLRASIEEARGRNGRLRGTKLKDARWWLGRRRDDLLPFEIEFIERSQRALNYGFAGLAAAGLIIIVISIITYARRNQPHQTALEAEKIVVKALSVDDPLQTALLLQQVKTEPENAKQYLDRVRAKMAQPIPRAVLRGHTDVVRTVDFSPDDTMLVTAGDDEHAMIWGTAAGELRISSVIGDNVKPPEDTRSIPAARFLDSDSIVVLGFAGNVRLLDLTGTPFKKLITPIGSGRRLGGVDPINKKIVLYSELGMVAIVDWKNDAHLPLGVNSLRTVVTTPGLLACLGKTDLWFLTIDGKETGVPRKNLGGATAMAFADKTLFAEADGVVWRVVPDSPDSDHMFATPLSNVTTMAMIGGTHVALGNEDGTVIVCDLDGHNARKFIGHRGSIRDIRISHNGQLMATASAGGTARIWSLGPVPAVPNTFTEIAKSIAGRTTACFTSAERSLLLGETATDALTNATACEQQHGRASVHAAQGGQP